MPYCCFLAKQEASGVASRVSTLGTSALRPAARRALAFMSPRASGRSAGGPAKRGNEVSKLVVNGFIKPVSNELPMGDAVEMNHLTGPKMQGFDWLAAPPRYWPRCVLSELGGRQVSPSLA